MPSWLLAFGLEFWNDYREMAPYLLFGFLAAGILKVLVPASWVERHLGGKGLGPIVKASAAGVPLPVCSCGVIPLAVSLRQHGASRGATTSFLISTPQTGVDSILVTFSLLGPVFAIFRPVAAFFSGILGGVFVAVFGGREESLARPPAPAPVRRPGMMSLQSFQPPPPKAGWRERLQEMARYGLVTLPRDIALSLTIGLLAAGVIGALVPEDFFADHFDNRFLAMLAAVAVGIPIYVCATGSVPVGAALLAKGISPGAVLVFLMTGPASNAATVATLLKVLGKRAVVLYLLAIVVTAVGAGLVLDLFVHQVAVSAHTHQHRLIPEWLEVACAAGLTLLLAAALVRRKPAPGAV